MAELRLRRLADLVWYLTEGVPQFERSAFGQQLAKSDLEGHQTTCSSCGGSGVYGEHWLDLGMRKYRKLHPGEHEAWALRESDKRKKLGKKCKGCKGTGERPSTLQISPYALTVQPSAQCRPQGEDSRELVSDEVMLRYAKVSRWLGQLTMTERNALCAAYMQEPAREGMSAAEAREDRIWAVLPVTSAGRAYIRESRMIGASDFEAECSRRIRALRPTPLADQARVLNDWSALCESEDETSLPLVQVVPDPLPEIDQQSWQEVRKRVEAFGDASCWRLWGDASNLLNQAEERWSEVVGPQVKAQVRKPLLGSVGHLAAWIRAAAPSRGWSHLQVRRALAHCSLMRGSAYDVRAFAKAVPDLAQAYFAAFRYWPKPGRGSVTFAKT